MNIEDTYKLLVGAYYGVREIDEYSSKEYMLNDIKKYIENYIKQFPLPNFEYKELANEIEKISLKRKLQDSLIVLNKLNAPLELVLLIRKKLDEMPKDEF